MVEALIFDLDGVVVDTAKYHYLAWKALADELGLPFTKDDNELLKGVSRQRSFQIILELSKVEMPQEEQAIYCARKNQLYRTCIEALEPSETLPGVVDFIHEARAKGLKIALGSASKNAVFILERLGLTSIFDAVVDGTKVKEAKPNSEVFLNAAKEMAVSPSACVVFEDAIAGIQAAIGAGMYAVGVGDADKLKQAFPHHVITGFESMTMKRLFMVLDSE